MCGLFGFCGKGSVNFEKIKILGLYNVSRGTDSCGYFSNGRIIKSADFQGDWAKFIVNNVISLQESANLFIGHTRRCSSGLINLENAHPFDINGRLIIAHNGTILNIDDLSNKYLLNIEGLYVDSFALGHLLDNVGYRVLQEYIGYAALSIHRRTEPGTVYLFRGASRLDTIDLEFGEERPLFLMNTREGYYWSSIYDSLMAIRVKNEEVPQALDCNRLISISNGALSNVRVVIDRSR